MVCNLCSNKTYFNNTYIIGCCKLKATTVHIVHKCQKNYSPQKFSNQNLVNLGCKNDLYWPHLISKSYNLVLYLKLLESNRIIILFHLRSSLVYLDKIWEGCTHQVQCAHNSLVDGPKSPPWLGLTNIKSVQIR